MSYLRSVYIKLKNHLKYRHIVNKNRGMFPTQIYLKYHPDFDFEGRKVLNFGCGKCTYKAPNVLNVDAYPGPGVVVRDPSRSLAQFGRDFDFIIANHVMEHVPNWYECFKEMAQILKPGGRIEIWVPPVSSDAAFTYLDHINLIGQASFVGVGNKHQRAGSNLAAEHEYEHDDVLKDLRMIKYEERPISTWWTILAPECVITWMSLHLRNVISEEGYTFEKVMS